ncbi:MAG TPA: PDZ domain-containing protein [Gemmatimonadales bacterium]|nr:PDZ domain-containing protein [Gemmatimonadales bacterium]
MARNGKLLAGILAAMIGLPMAGTAQQPERERQRIEIGPRAFAFALNRGRIGVVVKADEDREADRIGARIEAVTPGGPAEKAGLQAGDIITRFNGISLARNDEDDSHPANKLVRLAQALDPGDTVRIEYRRGSETRNATLVADEVEFRWSWADSMLPMGEFRVDPDMRFRVEPPGFDFVIGAPWGSLELVRLNPDLAEYFGTQEGVLVVRAAGGDGLPLKGGDVILAIDGRKPTSPAHAMRILRSYDQGETVKIDVLRKQKRITLTWTVPERESRVRRAPRRAPEGEGT